MLVGGLFLIYKSTVEIHHKLEGHEEQEAGRANVDFLTTLVQISLIDIVFSLDSVITAVGMAGDHLWVMVTAMILSLGVMLVFAGPIADFVAQHPTVKVLALSFLILIGVMLMVEGFHTHIPKEIHLFCDGVFLCRGDVEPTAEVASRRCKAPRKTDASGG
jgi:predicted tellurium resistance membrane protein TerC